MEIVNGSAPSNEVQTNNLESVRRKRVSNMLPYSGKWRKPKERKPFLKKTTIKR